MRPLVAAGRTDQRWEGEQRQEESRETPYEIISIILARDNRTCTRIEAVKEKKSGQILDTF